MSEGESALRTLTELRRVDRDRFLCALAAPASLRADLATLYAFNAELAGIADKVSEPMLGLSRLQWWREALNDIAAGRRHRHSLVGELADVIVRRRLSAADLAGLIDVRERDVERWQPATADELEAYAAATAGRLAELALDICTMDADAAWRQAARQAGTAYGLVGIARATPYFARQGRVLLPVAAGLDRDRLLALAPGPDVIPAIRNLAERAAELLAAARLARLPRSSVAALFPGRLAAAQLEQLRRHGYDPFAAGLAAPSGLNIWRLLAARWMGRI